MKGKIKRIFVSFLAVLCAFSSIAVVGVGAKSQQREKHIVVSQGCTLSRNETMSKKAKHTENYPSYPTVNDGTKSTIKTYAVRNGNKSASKTITLNENSSAVTSVNFGNLDKGTWKVKYIHKGGGELDTTITSINWY